MIPDYSVAEAKDLQAVIPGIVNAGETLPAKDTPVVVVGFKPAADKPNETPQANDPA